ncbi:MAG: DUF2285 domain-containing protein [Proteobacteria bacterium]|nr:DUF2285 domain-containing protein [Pseudomonadota bacterium]
MSNAMVPAPKSDWRDPENYRWMTSLPRTAWAWEFLRRNTSYGSEYARHVADLPGNNEPEHLAVLRWGLLRFENPVNDARIANVLWQMKACRDVLPLAAAKMRPGTAVETLDLSKLHCRTAVYDFGVEERREVLLTQDGRSLQLTVFGSVPLEEALLLTPALPEIRYGKARLQAVKRLADVVKHGSLRPSLYRRERQNARLARVVQALDGWLAKATQREIAVALFSKERVDRDWQDPRNHLRDHVRRAVAYGRELMDSRYRRFLG